MFKKRSLCISFFLFVSKKPDEKAFEENYEEEEANNEENEKRSLGFEQGDFVWGYYPDDGNWYTGTISEIINDTKAKIEWSDFPNEFAILTLGSQIRQFQDVIRHLYCGNFPFSDIMWKFTPL